MNLKDKVRKNEAVVCVVGLGYVGLQLATEFSKSLKVIGFDIDKKKIKKLRSGPSKEKILFTADPKEIARADFILITVPTPVRKSKEPYLSHVKEAAKTISKNLKKGSMVILESTVYPGVTEEIVKPILEKSGLKCGKDFWIGYSPERINPGDTEHTLKTVTKIVRGMDEETTEVMVELYGKVCNDVFRVKDIKTAETAKATENIQRDLNIALVNELALIFDKMGLNTKEVLDAASTKWNFHRYEPGLVGGHCIPVDPHYLVYKAKEVGYHPQVILAGRSVNDYMSKHVAELTIRALNDAGKVIKGSTVLIMGLTYKENVPDTRETPVRETIKELKKYNVEILGYDPLLENIESEFGIKEVRDLDKCKVDCVIIAVAHDAFKEITLDKLEGIMKEKPVLIDVRRAFDGKEAKRKRFFYKTL